MAESQQASPLLRMRGISKSFPGVRALDSVDFDVWQAVGSRAGGESVDLN